MHLRSAIKRTARQRTALPCLDIHGGRLLLCTVLRAGRLHMQARDGGVKTYGIGSLRRPNTKSGCDRATTWMGILSDQPPDRLARHIDIPTQDVFMSSRLHLAVHYSHGELGSADHAPSRRVSGAVDRRSCIQEGRRAKTRGYESIHSCLSALLLC